MENEKDIAFFQNHIQDLIKKSEQSGLCLCSDFLSETQRRMVLALAQKAAIQVSFFGGFAEAERVQAVLAPNDVDAQSDIVCLKMQLMVKGGAATEEADAISHRDYLGSLLGLGIAREKIGDIIPDQRNHCGYVFAREEISDFIMESLTSVKRLPVEVSFTQWQDDFYMPEKKTAVISLSSFRLDALVSRGFNLSRGDGALAVKQGRIFVNGAEASKGDKQLKVGDTVTFRGKGRIVLVQLKGKSKSNRFQLVIDKYGKI